MKTFTQLKEAREKRVVFSFGRMNPPTIGHEKLVQKIISEARKRKAEPQLYLSHSQDKKKNPLTYRDKAKYVKMGIPGARNILVESNLKTPFEVLEDLAKKKYTHVTMVVGSDRVQNFKQAVEPYLKDYGFEFDVVSAGERDPDSDDVSGMSASKMRNLALEDNYSLFVSGVPSKLSDRFAKEMFQKIRKNMGLREFYMPIGNSYGMPRYKMPQIRRKDYEDFLRSLYWRGVKVKQEHIPTQKLQPTQRELNTFKIQNTANYLIQNKEIRPIIVSNDNYILDGHHQWAALMQINQSQKIPCFRVDLNIEELINFANSFRGVEYEEFQ